MSNSYFSIRTLSGWQLSLLFISFLLLAPACAAQSQFPDTPAGSQTKNFLDAFNSGDTEKYKAFLSKEFPTRVQKAERDMEFREEIGGYDLKKVVEATPTRSSLWSSSA